MKYKVRRLTGNVADLIKKRRSGIVGSLRTIGRVCFLYVKVPVAISKHN